MLLDCEISKKGSISKLLIDKKVVEKSYVGPFRELIQVFDPASAQMLMNASLMELAIFERVEFLPLESFQGHVNVNIKISFSTPRAPKSADFQLYIQPDSEEWSNPYSFSKYRGSFYEEIFKGSILNELEIYRYDDLAVVPPIFQDVNLIEIEGSFEVDERTVAECVGRYVEEIKRIDGMVCNALVRDQTFGILTGEFSFPENIRSSCEQYLLYFGTFLKDLGISASAEIKEKADKVLFSVIPTDDSEALSKIREALSIYLDLPTQVIAYDDSFAAMRLEQQIRNLEHAQRMGETEVRLAFEVIESTDKIISQKDSTIEQQRKIIEKITSKSIMMDSLEDKEEFEKIFDGFEVGESKWLKENLGIKINPVKSLKALGGKLLKKDGEIVTLDLVEREEENDANN